MCTEAEFPTSEEGGELIAVAAERVVSTISEEVLRDLFVSMVCNMIGDAGDLSTLEVFERVTTFVLPVPYTKVDRHQVRATCAAAAAVYNMLPGTADNTDYIVRLAAAAVRGTKFQTVIR